MRVNLDRRFLKNVVLKERPISITKDILNGERGCHVGVFFDLDRTLIKGFSYLKFAKNRLLNGKLKSEEVLNNFLGLVKYAFDHDNFEEMITTRAQSIKGILEKEFIDIGKICAKEIKIYEESSELVAAHISMGHTVCIVSGASEYQINPIARQLGIKIIECTRLEVIDGKFTGKINFCCYGKGKLFSGKKLAEQYNLDLSKSYFYTDSIDDLELLKLVGNPRPINPDIKLVAISAENKWPVKIIKDGDESEIGNILRAVLSYASFIPSVIKGYSEGGIYSAFTSMSDMVISINGVTLNIKGKENLWKNRPAVFILNHQSSFDMLIAISLLRTNVTGVIKKEIGDYPILGQLLRMANVVFVDNQNRNDNIKEKLLPAVEGLKKGISLVIFPEGTRSFDHTLANFKKGAFHIAIQAKVPIVPIIIKNSHDIMPRGSHTINPGTVDITVLESISTVDWTPENMDSKIKDIRNLYLKELGQN
jgi:putative phosphoserine phosphatase/1-acylglycerol-3-phosphate O-acyltransferase